MKLWLHFWAYWKWFCTALVTSTILLLLVATLIDAIKSVKVDQQSPAQTCLERGGAWVEEEGRCRFSA